MSGDECSTCGRLLDDFGQCWACDASGEAQAGKAKEAVVPFPLVTLTTENLQDATVELIRATHELERSARVLAEVRFELDTQEATLIASGIEGKNEAERKANLRLKLESKYAELHGAELGAAQARRDVEVARIQLDGLRYQLRLLEVRQGGRA